MYKQLLNPNSNAAILLAGILAIVIGVGVARFAFTSLLPFMLEDFLTLAYTGVLASFNFVGYLAGGYFFYIYQRYKREGKIL